MEQKRRYLFWGLVAGLVLFLGLVFHQFLLAGIILPVATVLWLLLRLFVLSIDQQIYWLLLIFLIVLFGFIRLLRVTGAPDPDPSPEPNPTLDRVHYWQTSILSNTREIGERNYLRQDLRRLLAARYAAGRQGSAHFEVEAALKQRDIPLPEPIYAFLFEAEPEAPAQPFFRDPVGSIARVLRSARQAPRRLLRRWSGREAAEYRRTIDEVLTLLESGDEK